MLRAQAKWRDCVLALLVLALVFLNFGHGVASPAYADGITAATTSWCGDPVHQDGKHDTPCHACRIGGGADLPPLPCTVLPVAFAALGTAIVALPQPLTVQPLDRPSAPRAPPVPI